MLTPGNIFYCLISPRENFENMPIIAKCEIDYILHEWILNSVCNLNIVMHNDKIVYKLR